MRCIICDKDSETVTMHSDCAECEEVIFDTIAGYRAIDDQETIPEEDDGIIVFVPYDDDLFLSKYRTSDYE